MQVKKYLKLRALMRRVLGGSLSNTIRNLVVSLRYSLHLVPAEDRPRKDCVSALMRVRNEELWIEPSILSIKDLVDEYVIVDASTDSTPIIIERLAREYKLNIVHEMDFDSDIVRVSQKALEMTSCRWILRWNGDFVMHERGVNTLKQIIERFNRKRRYCTVYWPHVVLVGDLFHVDPQNVFQIEHWLTTYVPGMRFIRIPNGFEYLYVPSDLAYRIELREPLSFHLKVDKPENLLVKKYRWECFLKNVEEPLDRYIKRRIVEEFGTADLNEAAKIYYTRLHEKLKPYDRGVLDYPEVLKRYVYRRFGIELMLTEILNDRSTS